MLYSNDSDDAVRACEEARTGFYGYDEGDSSCDESPDIHPLGFDFVSALVEATHQKALREMRERWS